MVRFKAKFEQFPDLQSAAEVLRDFFQATNLSVEMSVIEPPEAPPILSVMPYDSTTFDDVQTSFASLQERFKTIPSSDKSLYCGSLLSAAFTVNLNLDSGDPEGYLLRGSGEVLRNVTDNVRRFIDSDAALHPIAQ